RAREEERDAERGEEREERGPEDVLARVAGDGIDARGRQRDTRDAERRGVHGDIEFLVARRWRWAARGAEAGRDGGGEFGARGVVLQRPQRLAVELRVADDDAVRGDERDAAPERGTDR